MNKKIVEMMMVVAMMLAVAGEALGDPIVVQRSRVDSIRGATQNTTDFPVGYFVDEHFDGISGVSGAGGSRRCHIPIIQFTLPELSALGDGDVIQSVTINYVIWRIRHNSGTDFNAHVYLLDTADPSVTGTDFYFHGSTDSASDVMFVGETELERSGTDDRDPDPPIAVSHTLTGDALLWFQDLYDGAEATQTNVFFRFNRSIATTDSFDYDRFYIETGDQDLFLEVVTGAPVPIIMATDTTEITETSARAVASTDLELTDAVLVWDTEDQGTESTGDWPVDNRLSLGAQTAGEVTGDMTNLDADTAYVWRLYGSTSGASSWTEEATAFITDLSAAQTPVFTNATALSPVAIQLDWEDNAENETGYILQRSTTSGSGYTTIATLGQGVTTYEDSGLMPGTTYYYQLAATNSVNGSATAFAACRISATTPQASWARATSANMYEAEIDGVKWEIHVFTNVGTYVEGLVVESPGDVEYLIVAGGGGGGGATHNRSAGGGGAGGLLTGIEEQLAAGSYDIVVGDGGAGGEQHNLRGDQGGNSSAFGLVAIGGGVGGGTWNIRHGTNGGSGGGAGTDGGTDGDPGSGTEGQGHDGGLQADVDRGAGGGGGGAGGPGGTPTGGAGLSLAFAGPEEVEYARGGDGGPSSGTYLGEDGAPNTGAGGEGTRSNNGDPGGDGGSGIVIVRYQIPPQGTVIILQ